MDKLHHSPFACLIEYHSLRPSLLP